MKQHVIFFEVEGGSDKGPDGHRKDTVPMMNALEAKGWSAEVVYYSDRLIDEHFDYVSKHADAYVSRINPGSIPGGEKKYFNFLAQLNNAGVIGMPTPQAMTDFGAKDALCKLIESELVPNDTVSYYKQSELETDFPKMLSLGERVLKQNRGSTGEGIWRVVVCDDVNYTKGEPLPLDTKIKCTEAVDNHVEYHKLGEFLKFCNQYIVGDNGMLLDMPFLPRIKEGEIRILMVGEEPIFVVHKKPAEGADAFSATLFSGAKYTYDEPKKWETLINIFDKELPWITEKLGNHDIPLIWTADFILDWDENKQDKYVLGEINCSCVGFTSHLDQGIQDKVANEIIRVVHHHNEKAKAA